MPVSKRLLLPLALAAFCWQAQAAVLPPEKLLPKDTLIVLSAPDWNKAKSFWGSSPYSKLWQDPSMKPFTEKFLDKFTNAVVKPLEQNLGIKFSDYNGLAQGQLTFALVPITPKDKGDSPIAGILIMDAKDHAGQLKTSLAQAIKKWTDAGKTVKSQKIRETDFTTLIAAPDDLSLKKIFPSLKPAEPPDDSGTKPASQNVELTLGQSDTMLLVSDSTEAIEKVLSRQAGGMLPPLEESSAFQADYGPRLRGSPFYLWFNSKALVDMISKLPVGADDEAAEGAKRVKMILSSTGLANLTSASLSYQGSPDGTFAQFFLAVPEDKRPTLLKIFAFDAKDSSPPPFVPADAVKYWRCRLNIANSWKSLQTMLEDLVPAPILTQLTAVFQMAGKDKDEHYDLKSELLSSLGDDIIGYEKVSKATKLSDLKSPPSLYLVGSPNPEKLAAAIKVLMSIPLQGAPIKDREFLGRKIYTVAPPGPGGEPAFSINFSPSGGYLALSGDASMLEEYLRSSDNKGKSLMDMPALAEAAQKVGSMGTGLFGFQNENQSLRPAFDLLRQHQPTVQDILGVPLPPNAGGEQLENLLQWADFTLLPPFDTVSKYFYFSVYAGSFSPDGFALKMFLPTPPQLRQ